MSDFDQLRASRLLHLATSPGYADLRQIIAEMVQESADAWGLFDGWDKEQMANLGIVYQSHRKFRDELFRRITQIIIDAGVAQEHNDGQMMPHEDSIKALVFGGSL
jgi:hypothetical protein